MPVTPDDFLDLACDFDSAVDEMQLRNSVSRAYYSGYLHVIDRIQKAGIALSAAPSGMHDKLINSLNSNLCSALNGGMPPTKQYELAGILKLTKQLRTKSDYKLSETVTQYDKDTAIANARQIKSMLP
ncbi:MAG: hypothetical protein KH310_22490 [Enterobacteriaceae bacterium]|nr:hypothetical protein [Enterobacteriaceae bacterium]